MVQSSGQGTVATAKSKACLLCRNKHIKCNGLDPCSYCVERHLECVYVVSRRGNYPRRQGHHLRNGTRKANKPADNSSHSAATVDSMTVSSSPSASDSPSNAFNDPRGIEASIATTELPLGPPAASKLHENASLGPMNKLADSALEAYYYYCFPAHPFVLPRAYVAYVVAMPAGDALLAAMRWTGSLFIKISPAARDSLFATAYNMVRDDSLPRNGYLAQAMLVLVIGMNGVCKRDSAAELLQKLEDIALEIGLHRREFATSHGNELAVVEESWRRTWWELYTVDAMVAGVHRKTKFPLYAVDSGVALPCEEDEYLAGNIPAPCFLHELEDEVFSTDQRQFSSFAYRILCANIMGQLIHRQPISKHDPDTVRRLEAALTNWQLHLPESKQSAIQRNGKSDEMIFQALMMHRAMSVILHQPLSQLDTSVTETINSCAPPEHLQTQAGSIMYDAHAAHAIQAASEISNLVMHSSTMLRHSHFFACVVTLSSIVHFSHWAITTSFFEDSSNTDSKQNSADIRQYIKLNIGALRAMAKVWPAASGACLQIQSVAQELHNMRKKVLPSMQMLDETMDLNFTQALAQDDTLWQMWNSLG